MKGKQTNIRTLWTINTLLDGAEKTQTQIVKELNQIGKEIKNSKEAEELRKTTKAIESPIIKDLTKKNIINGQLKSLKGSNLKANFCTIPNTLESFINVLDEINNSLVDDKQKKFFISSLIESNLGEKQIKKELLIRLLEKQKIPQINFNKEEKEFIKFTLLNSPLALRYTILSIQNRDKEWELIEAKNYYIYKIQTLLNLDLLDQYLSQTYTDISTTAIEFETKISFNENLISNKPLSAQIDINNMNFKFIHKLVPEQ